MRLKHVFFLLSLFAIGLLSACGEWFEGKIQVRNADPSASIVSIYISDDCTDGWGSPEATGLSIPPGGVSQRFEVDVDSYDVRACYGSGNCGERYNRDVEINDTTKVNVVEDPSKFESVPWC